MEVEYPKALLGNIVMYSVSVQFVVMSNYFTSYVDKETRNKEEEKCTFFHNCVLVISCTFKIQLYVQVLYVAGSEDYYF